MKLVLFPIVLLACSATTAAAQQCLHGPIEQPIQRVRRERALQVARSINLAQPSWFGPKAAPPKYRPLDQLTNVLPTPPGFVLRFHTDGESYMFSLKDSLDPCQYAIFSDQDKRIYDGTPRSGPTLVPLTQ